MMPDENSSSTIPVFKISESWDCNTFISKLKREPLNATKNIWHFNENSLSRMSPADLFQIALVAKNRVGFGKSAFVAETQVEYSQLQFYLEFAKDMNTKRDISLFMNVKLAEEWLIAS